MSENEPNSNLYVQKLLKEIAFLRHENKNLKDDLAHFQELVRLLKHQRFAAKSEVFSYGMKSLFDEAENEADEQLIEPYGPWPLKPEKKRGKPIRKPLPASLERIRKIIDIPEDEKKCQISGEPLIQFGEEVSEKLAIEPAKLSVHQFVRLKYICKCPACSAFDQTNSTEENNTVIKIAEPEPTAIPKSMATSSLLAFIAVNKYADALPLYRQETIFSRSGIDLPRSTMATWMVKCGALVRPLINLAKDELLKSRIIMADETHYQILKRTGKPATSKSYIWVFMNADPGGRKAIIYEVGPSRSHTVPLEFLEGYEGFLQTDGFEGYESLASKTTGITLVGDWVHARRKFDEAVKAHGKNAGKSLANEGLELINKLFVIERDLQSKNPYEKLKIRQENSRPITETLLKWAETKINDVPPKSLTYKAISYMLERWEKLTIFLDNSIIGLDTNPVENAIRPFAIGRKNWMFSDTMAGAESSAALYSLICMAKLSDLNPFQYLSKVFEELPKAKSVDEVEALLPWNCTLT
jgi:transposase